MKYLLFITLLLNLSHSYGQGVEGKWHGEISVQGMTLGIVFNVIEENGKLSATMDSPDQGAFGIPLSRAAYFNDTLKLIHEGAGMIFEGVLEGDSLLVGDLKQAGMVFPLRLSHNDLVRKGPRKKPQTPEEPFPYSSEELTIENTEADVSLAGTLTLPNNIENPPLVILISGSGPQDRNESLMGHEPFWVIADHFSRNGIAVFRYDDRGVAKSTGEFESGTTADFASDAIAVVNTLAKRKDIDKKRIGVMGHSEGGIIAPIVATSSKHVSFQILLAGPALRGDKILLLQQALIAEKMGANPEEVQQQFSFYKGAFDIVNEIEDENKLVESFENYVAEFITMHPDLEVESTKMLKDLKSLTRRWMLYFLRYDPAEVLKASKCATLGLYGSKDLQVPAIENTAALTELLANGKAKNYKIITLENLNHLFQECEKGTPDEYGEIEQTIAPIALETMTKWILEEAVK